MKLALALLIFALSACTQGPSSVDDGFLGGVRISLSKSTISCADESGVTISSVPLINVGSPISVTLTARDQHGNIFVSPTPLNISFNATAAGSFSAVTDNHDGTYTATYTPTSNGTLKFSGIVNGQTLTSAAPPTLTVTSNFSVANSLVAVSATSVNSASTVTVTLTVYDDQNVRLTSGGLDVAFSTTGGSSTGTFSSITDHNDGTYTATLTGVTAGTPTTIRAAIYGNVVTSALPTVTVNPGPAALIAVSAGNSQSATVGTALSSAFTALVTDVNGNAKSGITVNWAVASGGGSVSNATNATNASGLSSSTLTLGNTAGTQTVTATINGTSTSTTFTATANADVPASIAVSSGNSQSGDAGTALSSSLAAVVRDTHGNVVPGATVDWAVTSGGGSVSSGSSSTNASGVSSTSLTLGNTAGTNTVSATVHGTAFSATFTATGVAGVPTVIAVSAGGSQTASVATTLSSAFVAVVKDAHNNVKSGVTVDWAVASGGGSLSSSSNATNASGLSSSTMTLGAHSGTQSATATVHGTAINVTFFATATSNPTLSSISPATGISTATTSVTLTGTGFETGASVSIGGSACTSVSVASATQLTCTAPTHAAGAANVVVTNSDSHASTLTNGFTYQTPANLILVEAPSATFGSVLVNSTQDLTLHATNLGQTGATSVSGSALTAPFAYKGGTYPGTGGTCGTTLAAAASCTIVLRFSPTSGSGAVSQSLQLAFHNGVNSSSSTLTLRGFIGTNSTEVAEVLGSPNGSSFCARTFDGKLRCWGNNTFGQLGNNSNSHISDRSGETNNNIPVVNLGTGRTVVSVSHGASFSTNHVCAILDNGSLKCWGRNNYGQLGYGDTATRGETSAQMGNALAAVDLGTGRTATQVVTGELFTCAILDNGSVKCWGYNGYGQLGQGHTNDLGDNANEMGDNLPAINLGTGKTAVELTAGVTFVCARLNDASVKCWGRNNSGQLGIGSLFTKGITVAQMGDSLATVDLGTGHTALKIAATTYSICAILDDHTVKCWGDNGFGQLGLGHVNNLGDAAGEMGDALPTVSLGTGLTANQIVGGANFMCAILNTGGVKCWGRNFSGPLGQGHKNPLGDDPNEMGDFLPPIDLGTGRTAASITAGNDHVCAILDNGSLKCWGSSGYGALGYGSGADRGDDPGELGNALAAVTLGTGKTAKKVFAFSEDTCAILNDDTLKCWGNGQYGRLGNGINSYTGDEPNEMGANLAVLDFGTGRTVKSFSLGSSHGCAVLDDNSLKCWGLNASGQLGIGVSTDKGAKPAEMGDALAVTDLGAGRTVVQIAALETSTCALLDNSTIKCWGRNNEGQLGQEVATVSVGTSASHMGSNLPVTDVGGTAIQLAGGLRHACALLSTGQVKCWGLNNFGQLGLGDTTNRGGNPGDMGTNLPTVNLGTGRTASRIWAGRDTTCALLDNNTLKCWGYNGYGTLGQGHTNNLGDDAGEMGDNLPTLDLGTGRTVKRLSMGQQITCVLLDNDTVKCWGRGVYGALGYESNTNRGDVPNQMGDNLPAVNLGTGRTVIQITSTSNDVCALLDDKTIKCWGDNDHGELGQGHTTGMGLSAGQMGDNLPVTPIQ